VRPFLFAIIPAALIVSAPAFAATKHLEVGKLECNLSGNFGAILGAQETTSCVFTPSAPGDTVKYTGTITEFGLDIGQIKAAKLVWLVDAVSEQSNYDLAGTYVGVEADASFGLGAGAYVLTGSQNALTLQPVAVDGEEGINAAVGVVRFDLKPAS
jgi:hypothetical protein